MFDLVPRSKSRRGKASPKTSKSLVSHPPMFSSNVQVTRKARYTVTTAFTGSQLQRASLLNHLITCTLTTANYRQIAGFKLNRFEIWSPGTSAFVPATCSVEWISTYGPTKIFSDTSMTIEPAHIVAVPPPNSLAGFWSFTGSAETDVLCYLTCPVNSIIDMSYTIIYYNGETPVLVTTTTSNTIGASYMLPLFGATTTNTVPVSYATTF